MGIARLRLRDMRTAATVGCPYGIRSWDCKAIRAFLIGRVAAVVGILAMYAMACPPAGEVARYEFPSSMALNGPKARRSRHDAGCLFHGLALCDMPKHASIPFAAAGTGSRAKGGSSLLVRRARADGVFVMATVSPSRSRFGCGGISTTSRVERRRAQSWFRFLGADRASRDGVRAQARIRLLSDPSDLRRRIE